MQNDHRAKPIRMVQATRRCRAPNLRYSTRCRRPTIASSPTALPRRFAGQIQLPAYPDLSILPPARPQLSARPLGAYAVPEGVNLSMTNTQHNWEPFALLLIDVQRDFWSERAAHVHPDFPANIAALLTLCRREGIDVIHLWACFRADRSDWMPNYLLHGRTPASGEPQE
jgi:hypothetical protein